MNTRQKIYWYHCHLCGKIFLFVNNPWYCPRCLSLGAGRTVPEDLEEIKRIKKSQGFSHLQEHLKNKKD